MTVRIRCHRCHSWNELPDGEAWRAYAATGSLIQTLTERIVAQPIHKHYHTPAPVMIAHISMIPITAIGVPVAMYNHVDGNIIAGTWIALCWAIYTFAASHVEVVEEPEPQSEDEPEAQESQPTALQPFIEVSKPGPNSLKIRVAHEPPANPNPTRQRTLGQADIALARLVTGPHPVEPISWANVRKAGYRPGEKTFYLIQQKWVKEGLAFRSENGAVYLKAAGRNILAQYAQRTIN